MNLGAHVPQASAQGRPVETGQGTRSQGAQKVSLGVAAPLTAGQAEHDAATAEPAQATTAGQQLAEITWAEPPTGHAPRRSALPRSLRPGGDPCWSAGVDLPQGRVLQTPGGPRVAALPARARASPQPAQPRPR